MSAAKSKRTVIWRRAIDSEATLGLLKRRYRGCLVQYALANNFDFFPSSASWVDTVWNEFRQDTKTQARHYMNPAVQLRSTLIEFAGDEAVRAFETQLPPPPKSNLRVLVDAATIQRSPPCTEYIPTKNQLRKVLNDYQQNLYALAHLVHFSPVRVSSNVSPASDLLASCEQNQIPKVDQTRRLRKELVKFAGEIAIANLESKLLQSSRVNDSKNPL